MREFVERAFAEVGVEIAWRGEGIAEQGFDAKTGRVLVEIDPEYFRPTEVEFLLGDAAKARAKLGWVHKTSFAESGEGNGRQRSRLDEEAWPYIGASVTGRERVYA